MSESTAIALQNQDSRGAISLFDADRFEHTQRVAKMFSDSQLVPVAFQKNLPNCLIAAEIAHRMGAGQLAVMQSLNIIHGKPSWSSQFIIASINSSRRFTPLRFVYEGAPKTDAWSCYAKAKSLQDGEDLKGATVSIAMAKTEGWYGKSGSKWPSMGELMLMYRAATFFGRMYAPDMLMGMQTEDEAFDIHAVPVVSSPAEAADPTANPATETPVATTPRRRSTRGVSGMQTVTELAPAPVATTTPPPAEVAKTTPVAEAAPAETVVAAAEPAAAPVAAAATAAPATEIQTTLPTEPTPAAKPAPKKIRCEVMSATEVNASTPTGKVVKVGLAGQEFTGHAYFNGPFIKVPGNGSIVDVAIDSKESAKQPGTFVSIIQSIETVG